MSKITNDGLTRSGTGATGTYMATLSVKGLNDIAFRQSVCPEPYI